MKMENYEEIVFEKVYDITKGYMDKQNTNMPFSKIAFMYAIGHNANEIDMQSWSKLEARDFVMVAYLELLKRVPSESEMEYWISRSMFRNKLITTICSSMEYRIKNIEVQNNIYNKISLKQKLIDKVFGTSVSDVNNRVIYKIYKKFPNAIRQKIKKIAGLNVNIDA